MSDSIQTSANLEAAVDPSTTAEGSTLIKDDNDFNNNKTGQASSAEKSETELKQVSVNDQRPNTNPNKRGRSTNINSVEKKQRLLKNDKNTWVCFNTNSVQHWVLYCFSINNIPSFSRNRVTNTNKLLIVIYFLFDFDFFNIDVLQMNLEMQYLQMKSVNQNVKLHV